LRPEGPRAARLRDDRGQRECRQTVEPSRRPTIDRASADHLAFHGAATGSVQRRDRPCRVVTRSSPHELSAGREDPTSGALLRRRLGPWSRIAAALTERRGAAEGARRLEGRAA
jgi:hypothetical protein